MKEFDWEAFKDGKTRVACETKKESLDFLQMCQDRGVVWSSGREELDFPHYGEYEALTNYSCYVCVRGKLLYGNIDFISHREREQLLKWSDYMKKEFTKADLELGFVLEHRDGSRSLLAEVNGKKNFIKPELYSGDIDNHYRNDLTHIGFSGLDIMKVSRAYAQGFHSMLKQADCHSTLIWERKEPIKKYTIEIEARSLEEAKKIMEAKPCSELLKEVK